MCNTKLEKQSDPGRIIFIKQTSEAQTYTLCKIYAGGIINMWAAWQNQNGRQVLEGRERIVEGK